MGVCKDLIGLLLVGFFNFWDVKKCKEVEFKTVVGFVVLVGGAKPCYSGAS